jgi:hypothetical protein
MNYARRSRPTLTQAAPARLRWNQEEAVAVMLEKREVCAAMFHGFDWSHWLTGTSGQKFVKISLWLRWGLDPMPKSFRRRCDARLPLRESARDRALRTGELSKYLRSTRCKKWALRGSKRCRLHGGLSTGPKTSEGKARTVAAMVEGRPRLLEKLKAEGKPMPWGRKRGGVNRSAAERELARASKEHARARRNLEAFLSQKLRRQRRQAREGVTSDDGSMPWSDIQILQDRLREADDALERAQVEAAQHKKGARFGRSV